MILIVELNNKNFALLEERFIPDLGVEKIIFSSKNEFSLNLDKNFEISNEYILSNIDIKKFQITNNFKLKNVFPKINDKIFIQNNNLKIEYNKNNLYIEGKGDIYLQNNKDYIDFKVEKKNQLINFEGLIKLDKNPFIINFLNFKKDKNYETKIKFNGYSDATNKIFLKSVRLDENKNTIEAKNIQFSSKFKIKSITNINADYVDTQNQENIFDIKKTNNKYLKNKN